MSEDNGEHHGHGHGHGLVGSWEVWLGVPALRIILGAVVVLGVLTLVGLVVLWPDGTGRAAAIDQADELGFVTEQFDATVESVVEAECSYSGPDDPQDCISFGLIVHEGPDAGALVVLPEYNLSAFAPAPPLSVGDQVFLGYEPSTAFYFYADRDRGSSLLWLTILFAVVVIALGRWRGVSALAAMAVTVVVLVWFVAPSVLDGNDPVLVAVVAGSTIAFVGLYLTHGLTPTTTVALAGTLASLVLTLAISSVFFDLANFSGLATEEGLTLPLVADINLSSLLLGGAVLGTLGALDDVTVTQVATVAELHHRNSRLTVPELITSGIRVGREHIASTVNTLLLAYAGASMPLLLVFAASDQPLGVVTNSEIVAVEIVRTLCGSIGLVAAVPITTLMAAMLVGTTTGHDGADDGAGGDQAEPGPAAEPPPRPAASWDDFGPIDDL
ncbi:MAG: YibE/F family protein [Acidimicrobiales bacterium]